MKQTSIRQHKAFTFLTAAAVAFLAGRLLMGQTGAAAELRFTPSALDGVSVPAGVVLDDELVDRGSPFARHFRQPDGSVHAILTADPRWYKDADGRWAPVDTTIEARDGGFASERNTFKTYFPGASHSPVRIVTESGAEILYFPFQAVGGPGATVGAAAKSGAASGNRMGYDGVFPSANEEFFVTAEHLKHNLVLQGKPAWLAQGAYLENHMEVSPHATAYLGDFPVVYETALAAGQQFEFKNPDGSRLFEVPAPVAYELNNPAESVSMNMTLSLVDNGGYRLRTHLPVEWLNAPGRRYPVVIDPTAVLQPSQIDTQIRQADPTFNYGASTTMGVSTKTGQVQYMMVQFDLSSIPMSSTVNTATLELYATVGNQARTYNLHRITRSWTEGTGTGSATGNGATWNTYNGVNTWTTAGGDIDPTVASSTGLGTKANEWKFWNVTALAQSWIDGTYSNYGVQIRDSVTASANNEWRFASRENGTTANRPILRFDYTPPSSCAAVSATAGVDDAAVCQGTEQNFTGSGTGEGTLSYAWDFAYDGSTFNVMSSAQNPSYTYPSAGSYTARLRVTDSCAPAQTAYSNVSITIYANPSPVITGPSSRCEGAACSTLDAGAGYASYLWSPGGETTQAICVTGTGTYSVAVTDSNGCSGTSPNFTITEYSNPTVTISGATSRCASDACTTLTANPSGGSGSGYTYVWSPGGATTASICVSPSSTTTYTVTVTDSNGCSGTSAGHTLTVNANPAPTITESACDGSDNVVLDAGSGYDSYLWDDPGASTTQTIVVPGDGTTYTVTVTLNGCSGQASRATQVCGSCPAPGAVNPLAWDNLDTLSWGALVEAATYNLYRGDVSALSSGAGSCYQQGLSGLTFDETASPAAGETWFYIVTGQSACGADGSLGTDSDGAPRVPVSSCP